MSSITLHGASLYFGMPVSNVFNAAIASLGRAVAFDGGARERLLDMASAYESTQPSFASDLRSAAAR